MQVHIVQANQLQQFVDIGKITASSKILNLPFFMELFIIVYVRLMDKIVKDYRNEKRRFLF